MKYGRAEKGECNRVRVGARSRGFGVPGLPVGGWKGWPKSGWAVQAAGEVERAGERIERWDPPLDGDVSAFGGRSLWRPNRASGWSHLFGILALPYHMAWNHECYYYLLIVTITINNTCTQSIIVISFVII